MSHLNWKKNKVLLKHVEANNIFIKQKLIKCFATNWNVQFVRAYGLIVYTLPIYDEAYKTEILYWIYRWRTWIKRTEVISAWIISRSGWYVGECLLYDTMRTTRKLNFTVE